MTQANNSSFVSQAAELAGNHELVQVTHVESPVLFYCRLLTDEEQFGLLQEKIGQYINSGKAFVPNLNSLNGPNKYVLVYSVIRDRWCRGTVLSHQTNSDLKPINAKVCLIDYGSIEIVLCNANYIQSSDAEINAFNDGRGFCFPCSLGNIKPFDEGKSSTVHQWSSYANYLIEKETKNRKFILHLLNANQPTRNIVLCDLLPVSDVTIENEAPLYSQTQFTSLSCHLVNSNVARFVDQQTEQTQSDDEKENLFIANHVC